MLGHSQLPRLAVMALAGYVVTMLIVSFGMSGRHLKQLHHARMLSENERVQSLPWLADQPHKIRTLRCVGWRQTLDCNPDGDRDMNADESCSFPITQDNAGFCEVMDVQTQESFRVMKTWCPSIKWNISFTCNDMMEFGNFAARSEKFLEKMQSPDYKIPNLPPPKSVKPTLAVNANGKDEESSVSMEHGVTMVVYPKLLASAYATIRVLRSFNCKLPVEIWYRSDEMDAPNNMILQHLVRNFGPIQLHEIDDPDATGFYAKIHAVYYSHFRHMLFLDADNVPIRDPTYLFSTPEYVDKGAIFWPDFWSPRQHIFNIHDHALLWEYLGTPFVDMFEQESAQLLINREKHAKALEMLHFYAFYQPNYLDQKQFVYGDKDLFRLAWLKTQSDFLMIQQPPSFGGLKKTDGPLQGKFCGVTMVQHDPRGEMVFFHRNAFKLRGQKEKLDAKCWSHVVVFKAKELSVDQYAIQATAATDFFDDVEWCYGPRDDVQGNFYTVPIKPLTFGHVEDDLVQFAHESAWLTPVSES